MKPGIARYSLRPVEERDLEMLLAWRNSDRIRSVMYTDHVIQMDEHRRWFRGLAEGAAAHALIFEQDGRPLGTVNITRIDESGKSCHWGFYLGEPDAPRGSGAVMGYLGLSYIFGTLKLDRVTGEAFSFNRASVRFHGKLGFRSERDTGRKVLKNGIQEEVLTFTLTRDRWEKIKDDVLKDLTAGDGT